MNLDLQGIFDALLEGVVVLDDDGRVESSAGAIYPLEQRGDLEAIVLNARVGRYEPHHDLDGDGQVDARDVLIAQLALGRPPGR